MKIMLKWCDNRDCSVGVGSLCATWKFRGKELILPLKKKWFEMIKSGEKTEEYREINEYWAKRFCKNRKTLFCWHANGNCKCNAKENLCFNSREIEWDCVTFTCGYPRKDDTERRITFKNPSIRIGEGKEKWGAEKGKRYFVITWDKN